jgi:hypothetical protein
MPSSRARFPTRSGGRPRTLGTARFARGGGVLVPAARTPAGFVWLRVLVTLCTLAEIVLLVLVMSGALAWHMIGFVVLWTIIWAQLVFVYRTSRRSALGRRPHSPRSDVLGTDVMIRIADIERALTTALDTLGAAGPATRLSEDDLVVARRVAARGPAALRDLRGQMVALGRVVATALSPDQQRLTAARQTVRLRLMRGLRDCEEFASVAATPGTDDFPWRFADAAERVSILVADVNP